MRLDFEKIKLTQGTSPLRRRPRNYLVCFADKNAHWIKFSLCTIFFVHFLSSSCLSTKTNEIANDIFSFIIFFFRSLFRLPSFFSAVKFGHFCETMIWLDIYMYVCIHVSLDHDWNSRTFSYRRVRLRLFMIKRSAQSTPLVICLWKTHVSFPFNPFHLRIAVFLPFFFRFSFRFLIPFLAFFISFAFVFYIRDSMCNNVLLQAY